MRRAGFLRALLAAAALAIAPALVFALEEQSLLTPDGTLHVLRDFEPEALRTGGFDSRWGMLGRVRLLRAAAYEQLGRRSEALAEYRQVLSQWKGADESLKPFIRQAEQGLARLGEA